jgi:hypothetical protein
MKDQNQQNSRHTRGHSPKKSYDPEKFMQELIDAVTAREK